MTYILILNEFDHKCHTKQLAMGKYTMHVQPRFGQGRRLKAKVQPASSGEVLTIQCHPFERVVMWYVDQYDRPISDAMDYRADANGYVTVTYPQSTIGTPQKLVVKSDKDNDMAVVPLH
jgi:hypothetical protein